jgi:hypothetical protein
MTYVRLFNARYDSIYIDDGGEIRASTPGCGCCSDSETLDKQGLKEVIKELEVDLKEFKKLYKEIKDAK